MRLSAAITSEATTANARRMQEPPALSVGSNLEMINTLPEGWNLRATRRSLGAAGKSADSDH